MALTNAERQAKHRQRIKERLAASASTTPAAIQTQLQERLDALNGTICTLQDFAAHLLEQYPDIVAQMAEQHSGEALTAAPLEKPTRKPRMSKTPGFGDF